MNNKTNHTDSIHHAIARNDIPAISALIANGAQADYDSIAFAIAYRNADAVACLIDHGANVNENNGSLCNYTHLIEAAMKGCDDIVEILLNREADINAKDGFGMTALMNAVNNDHTQTAFKIISYGADINAIDNSGNSALSIAYNRYHSAKNTSASKVDANILKALIKSGADQNIIKNSYTLFMQALHHRHYAIASAMLNKSTILNMQNLFLETPIMIAAPQGKAAESICKRMLRLKPDLDVQDNDGNTAIMLAIRSKNTSMAKILLTAEQNLLLRNNENKTAFDLATEYDLHEVASIIEDQLLVKSIDDSALHAQHQIAF